MNRSASEIQNIVFDFGGVLVHFDPDTMIRNFLGHDVDTVAIRNEVHAHSDWRLYDRGRLDRAEIVQHISTRLEWTESKAEALLTANLESIKPIEGMATFVEELHGAGYRIFLLSNMPADFHPYFVETTPYWDFFEGEIISAHVDLLKPDPVIYKALIEKYNLRPAETLFVDDLAENINGALGIGMQAIQCLDPEACRQEIIHMLGLNTPKNTRSTK
jgi:putative hydrolase of the HAD superfamily